MFEPGGTKLLGSGSGPLRQTSGRESSLSLTQGFGPTSHRNDGAGNHSPPSRSPCPFLLPSFSPSQANAAIDRVGEGRTASHIFLLPVVVSVVHPFFFPFTCLGIYHPPSSLARAHALSHVDRDGEGSRHLYGTTMQGEIPPAPRFALTRSEQCSAWMSFCMQLIERGPLPLSLPLWLTRAGGALG